MNNQILKTSNNTILPLSMLIIGAIIYGSFFSATRIAVDLGVPPLAIAFWQGFLAAIISLFIAFIFKEKPKITWPHLKLYSAIGIFAFSIPLIAITFAAPHVPAGLLGLVLSLVPSLTYLFAFIARLERFNLLSTAGLILGLIGVLIIISSTSSFDGSFSGLWFGVAIIAPLGYAASNVVVAIIRPAEATTLQLTSGVLICSIPVLIIPMIIVNGFYLFNFSTLDSFGSVLWAGITNIVIFIALFEVIYRRGPVFFSQFNYIAPATALLWAYLIFNDLFPTSVWIAIVFMAAGLFLANKGTAKSIELNNKN
ncbi:DMT family transporter [Alphaproteobacteria bacterium]|nr:DMT family transporter [Alphaproteobacteria bacterium]